MSKLLYVAGGISAFAMIAAGTLLIAYKTARESPEPEKIQPSAGSAEVVFSETPVGTSVPGVASRVADDERPANVTEEWASKIEDPIRRRMAFTELGRLFASGNLDDALKKSSMVVSSDDRRALLQGIFGQIASKNPKTALEAAQRLDGADRAFALKTLALEWAFGGTGTKDGSMTSTASMGVALALASANPEAAAAWASDQISGRERTIAVAAIAREWAKTDPVAAATYAAQLSSEPGGGGRWLVPGVVEQWAATDPSGAAAWVATFPDSRERNMGVSQVITAWATKDTAQAITWANGLTDPKIQRTAYASIARTWASTEPQQAVSWALQISDPQAQASAVSAAISNWASQDPPAAAAAVASIGDESAKKDAITRIAFEWARRDLASATAWVNSSVPPGMKEAANKAISNAQRRELGDSR